MVLCRRITLPCRSWWKPPWPGAKGFSEAAAQAAEKGVRLIGGDEFARMLLDCGLHDIDSIFCQQKSLSLTQFKSSRTSESKILLGQTAIPSALKLANSKAYFLYPM